MQAFQNGVIKGGIAADHDGYYTINLLEPGNYDIYISYPGFDSIELKSVMINTTDTTVINGQMKLSKGNKQGHFVGYIKPLVNHYKPEQDTIPDSANKSLPAKK